jgi:hypothetical protein
MCTTWIASTFAADVISAEAMRISMMLPPMNGSDCCLILVGADQDIGLRIAELARNGRSGFPDASSYVYGVIGFFSE